MTRRILLFLGESLTAPISWGVIDGDRVVKAGRLYDADGLESLRLFQGNVEMIAAFLPGEQAALRRMETPPKTQSKFRAAASYMLEDELGEPVDAVHYATLLQSSGRGLVMAVRKSIMDGWRDAFEKAGLELDMLTSDTAAMIGLGEDVVLVRDDVRTVVGLPDNAFACENDLFDIISAEMIDNPNERTIECIGSDNDLPKFLATADVNWLAPLDEATKYRFYARALVRSEPVNLLQGAYRRKMQWRAQAAPWRRTGLLAAGLAAAGFFTIAADAFKNDRIGDRWDRLSGELHASAYPELANNDPVAHARSVLSSGADSASFLILNARFSDVIENNDEIQIERIGFDNAQGRFSVSIRAQSDAAIERLREELTASGVKVRDNGGFRLSGGQRVGELLAEL